MNCLPFVSSMKSTTLNGKVFVDYLSRMKQDRVRKKLKKEARLAESKAA